MLKIIRDVDEEAAKALNIARLTSEPGGYANVHRHLGAQIWYIDAATISTMVVEGTMRLTCGSDGATDGPTEEISPAMKILMSEGE